MLLGFFIMIIEHFVKVMHIQNYTAFILELQTFNWFIHIYIKLIYNILNTIQLKMQHYNMQEEI